MQNDFPSEKTMLKEAIFSPFFAGMLLFLLVWGGVVLGMTMAFAASALFAVWLSLLTEIDRKTMLLPDILTYSGMALGLGLAPLVSGLGVAQHVWGLALGYGLFAAVHYGFYALRGYHGLGFGDVKLLAMLGAWCGAVGLPLILLVASFAALPVFLFARIVGGADSKTPLPFGPFLCFGGWIVFLYGMNLWIGIFEMREAVVIFLT